MSSYDLEQKKTMAKSKPMKKDTQMVELIHQ